jgi:retinol dehydrogenase-12
MAHRYEETKLFNVLFSRSLTARLPPSSPLVVNSVNPGYCFSSIRRNVKFPLIVMAKLLEIFLGRATDEGAKTLVWGVTAGMNDPALRDSLKGAYTSNCRIEEPSDFIFTKEGQDFEKRIWVRGLVFRTLGTSLM